MADIKPLWLPGDQDGVDRPVAVGRCCIGQEKAKGPVTETWVDELMINGQIFDHQARLHSFGIKMAALEHLKD